MGQRNATYVIVQNKYSIYSTVLPIYNGWNTVHGQIPKLIRGIKAVLEISNVKFQYVPLDLIYFTAAGICDEQDEVDGKVVNIKSWVGGNIETDNFKNRLYTGAYQEDNNDGWNIVKFIIDSKGNKIDVELYCIVGSGCGDDGITSESAETYFNTEKCDKEEVKYLSQFKWNKKLELEAKRLIKKLIPPKKDLVI